MSLLTNLVRRGAVYYFRTRVPRPLRAKVGRHELWRSLRTSQAGEARRRAVRVVALTDALWRALATAMTDTEIKTLVDEWLSAQLDDDAHKRAEVDWHTQRLMMRVANDGPDQLVRSIAPDEIDTEETCALLLDEAWPPEGHYLADPSTDLADHERLFRVKFGAAKARHATGDTTWAAKHVDDLARALDVAFDDQQRTIAVRMMMTAHVQLLEAVEKRSAKRWRPYLDPDPAQEIVAALGSAPRAPQPQAAAVAGLRYSTARERHADELERLGDVSPSRRQEYAIALRNFGDWLGGDPCLSEITTETAGRYRLDLAKLPAHSSKLPAYKDLPFRERIEKARADAVAKTISPETMNSNYLSPLRGFFDWAKTIGQVRENPFENIKVKQPKGSSASPPLVRAVYTSEQLQSFVDFPIFAGAKALKHQNSYVPGPLKIRDWRYWVAIIGIFTGARLNEICSLYAQDLKENDGITYLHVIDQEEGQRVKSNAARRRVPVHHELMRLGLPEYIHGQRNAGHARLFPELKESKRGYFSHEPSKFYGRVIGYAIGEEPEYVFHSFRHTFITALRRARVPKDVRMNIVGHEEDDTHDDYDEQPLDVLNEAVQSVDFGLNLARLYPAGASS